MKKSKNPSHSLPAGLIASSLAADPRIVQAKSLLHEAMNEYRKQITAIRPPLGTLKQGYEEMLASFAKYRGAKLWFPYIGSGMGNGPFVELADGSIKYDFICGIGSHYWGHNHPDFLDTSIDTALSDTVMQGHLQQNIDSVDLYSQLTQATHFPHCFLTTSGAMANENALKIAFQKKFPAKRILAFERCFVGRTLAISQITDKPAFREGLPATLLVDYIPYFDPSRPEESTALAVKTLKKHLSRYPNDYAVMCFELVQGEGGFYSATKDFFESIMTILKDNDIAIFADEVQSFARTPELFAFQYFGLDEYIDIASIGKVSQVCATLFTEQYKPRQGLLSQTFTASTSAIKAFTVILNKLLCEGFFGPEGKIAKVHHYFANQLENLSQKHPDLIRGPYGVGSMIAFTPYDGETQKVTQFIHRLFDAGVISFIAGSNPSRVRFLVPVDAIDHNDIDNVINIIEKTLIEKL